MPDYDLNARKQRSLAYYFFKALLEGGLKEGLERAALHRAAGFFIFHLCEFGMRTHTFFYEHDRKQYSFLDVAITEAVLNEILIVNKIDEFTFADTADEKLAAETEGSSLTKEEDFIAERASRIAVEAYKSGAELAECLAATSQYLPLKKY